MKQPTYPAVISHPNGTECIRSDEDLVRFARETLGDDFADLIEEILGAAKLKIKPNDLLK